MVSQLPPAQDERLLQALAAGDGSDPARLRSLALLQAAAGRNGEALETLRRAIALAPDYAEAQHSLALLLIDLDRRDEAQALAQQWVQRAPDDAQAWHRSGMVLHRLQRFAAAAQAQQRALALDGNFRDAWRWLGFSLEYAGEIDGAIAAYEKALALRFEPATAVRTALLAPTYARSMDEIDSARRRIPLALEKLAASGFRHANPEKLTERTTAHYAYWGGEDLPLFAAQAAFWRRICPELEWQAPHVRDWTPPQGRKPRVAWVSHHVYWHSIDRVFGHLLRRLPGLGFEVRVFTNRTALDHKSREIESCTGPIIQLPDDLAQARQAIAAFAPDIVFYPELGLDKFIYFLGFARLAPLQATTWGLGATSGIPAIDCFVSDVLLDPPGNEAHYSEELIRLSRPPLHFEAPPPPPAGLDRAALGLPQEATLYLCMQSLLKLRPDFDFVLARILAADPKGFIVLMGGDSDAARPLLEPRMRAAIPDYDSRVKLLPWTSPSDYAGIIAAADAILDTPNFGGGTTAYETLARGRAFVTLPGPAQKGRVGTMLYAHLGIDELIARDLDHYVELACRLANDRQWRAEIEARIAARAPALFADETAIEEFAAWLHERIARPQPGRRSRILPT